ncbi:phosphate starvation-inducible protein PhoH [Actinobaculum suis]|uniref:PhoH-like protein n=1 Tax=Actinobaculum suis TaxID=1657 RepID=A0A1G7EM63_9ACTO|nr:PhoH family protein [Actinobaculum suis]MDY5153177.1 PhoH family protein [Actinobaculum suis]SDE64790.1 phosphate starvation-inducible protein PhoH [Actinobaculum suis]
MTEPAHLEMRQITVPEHVSMINVLGRRDEVLRALEAGLEPVEVYALGHRITVRGSGPELDLAQSLIEELIDVAAGGEMLTRDSVERAIKIAKDGLAKPTALIQTDILTVRGKTIRPKTIGQKAYVDAIDNNSITFGIGPAGSGKTYLAVAKAVVALTNHSVKRIILTRPAVEAGESLGYLPGSLNEKIDPYLRPLYDAMYEMLDSEAIPKLMGAGAIEVAPLAYMRGRTLNDAFVILDEAQNTTPEQMKMFLTRLGFNSKMVVTGDVTQIDLPGAKKSGLLQVRRILRDVPGIHFSELSSADVVRHRLVAEIIDAYARWDARDEK